MATGIPPPTPNIVQGKDRPAPAVGAAGQGDLLEGGEGDGDDSGDPDGGDEEYTPEKALAGAVGG